jgi:TatD DNase family protein
VAPADLERHPFGAGCEKGASPMFGYPARYHELDGGVFMHTHRYTAGARADADARLKICRRRIPQRQLQGFRRFVGYSHNPMIAATPPELIDIGANLTHESFAGDFADVMRRASHAGVHRLIVTGTSVAATRAAIALHREWPDRLFATAGLHPHHASEMDADVAAALRALCADPAVVAVGECGLDYYRNLSPRDAQLRAFRQQLEIAVETCKPVFLHQRDAHGDFISLLREFRPHLVDAVAHCFTGQASELRECLELDLAIGMTGWICDERRGRHLLPLMGEIPAGRLMIETDAPYLLPRSLKPAPSGRRNEPAFLTEVARVVAASRRESMEELARHTTATAEAFFRLPGASPAAG